MVKLAGPQVIRCVGASMSVRFKKPHAAFKHGAYSATAVLPGEDEDAFRELHQKIIAELAPVGALEEDLVGTIARLLWRKQNLAILRIVEFARQHDVEFQAEKPFFRMERLVDQTREELGEDYELVEIGETATVDRLLEDLQVEERLDATIDKCLKRLLICRVATTRSRSAAHSGPERCCVSPFTFGLTNRRSDAMIDKCLKRLLFLRGLKSLPTSSHHIFR
jgi:hypothetical protein